MMKKGLLFLTLTLLFIFSFPATSRASDISVYIDGQKIEFESAPVIIEGVTLVPMRALFEYLGATVIWDENTKTATGVKENNIIKITIGAYVAYRGNQEIALAHPATIIEGKTYVPLRFIAESLNCTVDWQDITKTIIITTSEKEYALLMQEMQELQDLIQATTPNVTPSGNISIGLNGTFLPLYLYSNDGKTYLGKLTTDIYASDGIWNIYGSYGSEYNANSIWNAYGDYGSEYSKKSAFNPNATNPPIIINSNGDIVGYLTENPYIYGGINSYDLYLYLVKFYQ